MGYADYMNCILISASCATLLWKMGGEGERVPYREENTGIYYLAEYLKVIYFFKKGTSWRKGCSIVFFRGRGYKRNMNVKHLVEYLKVPCFFNT